MTPEPHITAPDWDSLLRSCIHCGLCLNACPTYRMTGDEAESPRGRIMLLRDVLEPVEGEPPAFDRGPLDRCMGCRGCETVCPSGVQYGHLLAEGRSRLPVPPAATDRFVRWLIRHVLPYPRRLTGASWMGRIARTLRIPLRGLAAPLQVLPRRRPHWPRLAGPEQGDVAVLAGCAQPVFSPGVLGATVRLIRAAGHAPCVPRGQGCCGALAEHCGEREQSRVLGRALIDALEGTQAIVVPSAGCSAHMREWGELFRDDPHYAERARQAAARTVDLVVWLGDHDPGCAPDHRRVVFQRSCHLRHAQGVEGVAERVLARVPGLELVDSPRADLCCGSAGSWSLQYPAMALERRRAKMADLLEGGPDLVLTANPGCELFLDAAGEPIPVRHIAEYLADLLPDD